MKDVKESVDRILDQAIARAEAQLSRHSQSLADLKEMNALLKKQGKPERDLSTMQGQVDFYTAQITELKNRKS